MVTEEGVIERVFQQRAEVRIRKSSACANCESRDGCEILSGKEILIEVANDLEAKVGDHVEISVSTGSLLKLSLLVYFVPIVALVIGASAGSLWAQSFGVGSTLASIVGGGFLMGITFFILRKIDRAARDKGRYYPLMTRILFNTDSLKPSDST